MGFRWRVGRSCGRVYHPFAMSSGSLGESRSCRFAHCRRDSGDVFWTHGGQYWDDHRAFTRDRYPVTLRQLWRNVSGHLSWGDRTRTERMRAWSPAPVEAVLLAGFFGGPVGPKGEGVFSRWFSWVRCFLCLATGTQDRLYFLRDDLSDRVLQEASGEPMRGLPCFSTSYGVLSVLKKRAKLKRFSSVVNL
ncbi:hypothetical protein MPNT_10434 [Candidatus Methylacidithermus pantelleriae]|uniref:Uncharacterized protein n=1 Tax=Candidatus Methylacidithermus pantelleriae TaxID=2744239 RepID=A0A8J2BKR1_9BACT|nr:hypothetical protein MPNT_10434 [Candidatus Methylacidithermus pantelleriae]